MADLRSTLLEKVNENRQLASECKSLRQFVEKLQKEMKVKDEIIGDIKDKLLAKDNENERLQKTNKKLLEIVSSIQLGSPISDPNRKLGISDEPTASRGASGLKLTKHPKDISSRIFINEALNSNEFLKNLQKVQIDEIVDSMYIRDFAKGQFICHEGDVGTQLYVLAEGEIQVTKGSELLQVIKQGVVFGELAVLYNCKRTATIEVLTPAKVWTLDRNEFHGIMMKTGIARQTEQLHFLKSVSLFKHFSDVELLKIADVLQEDHYQIEEYIIRQGAVGETFFIIKEGTVKVTHRQTATDPEIVIEELSAGGFFGEKALRGDFIRTASVIATSNVSCFTLDKDHFHQLIHPKALDWPVREREEEPLQEPKDEEDGIVELSYLPLVRECNGYAHLTLSDLVYVKTLGAGGFGRVDLVQPKSDLTKSFALKCLAKKHIVATHQQAHIFSEKNVLQQVNCPFVAQIYKAFRCSKYLYILMEVCLGGELWTLLRDLSCFDDSVSRFCTGCVVAAFEYLHSKEIVFRDLKPENLLLDSYGYVKLVDFGFAKHISESRKTWTFCGTPEYVSPEIILNKGHDCASDYWSLGILIFELLTGSPPFTGGDSMRTYNLILKGIDAVNFPKKINKNAQNLIKRLCKENPSERLGNLHAGIKDIKRHRWFEGFDWENLSNRTMKAPLIPNVRGPTDSSNFDIFRPSQDSSSNVSEDLSGWDEEFGPLQGTPSWL